MEKQWPQRFLETHPQYEKIKQKPISKARKHAMKKDAITKLFEKYQRAIVQYKIKPNRTYDIDETDMPLGVGREQ